MNFWAAPMELEVGAIRLIIFLSPRILNTEKLLWSLWDWTKS